MGALCSREKVEYEAMMAMRPVTDSDSDMTYMTQSREETLRSLKTGDLIFVRIGDCSSDRAIGWIRCGVLIYAPTQLPSEECLLAEYGGCHDDGLPDALNRSKVEEGIRVVSFPDFVNALPSHWSVYVRRLEGPPNYTTTHRRHNYNSDYAQADALAKIIGTSNPGNLLVPALLTALGITEEQEGSFSYEKLAKQEIRTRHRYNYKPLEKIF